MNFKKPDAWVTAVSIVLVAALSVGFAANKTSSNDIANSTQALEVTTTQVVLNNYSGNAVKPLGESLLRYGPESEYRISDIVAMQIFYPEGTVKLSLYCQPITGKPILLRSVDFTVESSNERNKPDIRNPDIFVWKVAIDFPYGFSGTIWAEAIDADGEKFPSDVCKANSISSDPLDTSWQDISVGMLREDVHKIMGEPAHLRDVMAMEREYFKLKQKLPSDIQQYFYGFLLSIIEEVYSNEKICY